MICFSNKASRYRSLNLWYMQCQRAHHIKYSASSLHNCVLAPSIRCPWTECAHLYCPEPPLTADPIEMFRSLIKYPMMWDTICCQRWWYITHELCRDACPAQHCWGTSTTIIMQFCGKFARLWYNAPDFTGNMVLMCGSTATMPAAAEQLSLVTWQRVKRPLVMITCDIWCPSLLVNWFDLPPSPVLL